MSRTKGFESLRVYRLSEQLADVVWEMVTGWNILAKDTVGKQMIRSTDSIGTNLAEGTGRGTYKDNCRFVDNARGSLYETRHWLRRAYKRHLLKSEHVNRISPLLEELAPKLNAYRNSLKRRSNSERPLARPRPANNK